MDQAKNWIGSGEAARRLGYSRIWVRTLAERGEIDSVKTPIGFLFDPASVEAYRKKREAERMGSR